MYMPEVRKEEVINRVTEVIEQNLDLVQQIAFLLGEGAAKTEKMLNTIEKDINEKVKEMGGLVGRVSGYWLLVQGFKVQSCISTKPET